MTDNKSKAFSRAIRKIKDEGLDEYEDDFFVYRRGADGKIKVTDKGKGKSPLKIKK